jgi:hypothetical protein
MNLKCLFAALLVVSSASSAMAQTSAVQNFRVVVPTNISITAPTNAVITHDQSDDNQQFPAQQWVVRGNTLAGVAVSISTNTPFVNTTDPSFKRDAQLALAVNGTVGPAVWTVGQALDTTNYVAEDGVATVTASSNGVGRATLDLTMRFLTNGFGTFAAGDYQSTVTGTVTAN